MNKCMRPDCNGTASKDSAYCLTCEQDATIRQMFTPPASVWAGIEARIKASEKTRKEHMNRIVIAWIVAMTLIWAGVIAGLIVIGGGG